MKLIEHIHGQHKRSTYQSRVSAFEETPPLGRNQSIFSWIHGRWTPGFREARFHPVAETYSLQALICLGSQTAEVPTGGNRNSLKKDTS